MKTNLFQVESHTGGVTADGGQVCPSRFIRLVLLSKDMKKLQELRQLLVCGSQENLLLK